MRIVLSGGGTAGHINPALALAEQLVQRGHEVYYAGTPEGVEARLVPQAGVPFEAFEAAGFNRSKPASLVRALSLVRSSTAKAQAWFARIRPDAAVCFGGYVCIPVGRAALKSRVPLVVHEQNSVMGMANKYLAKRADAVALTYEMAGEGLSGSSRILVTGNPVRGSVLGASRSQGRTYCNVPDDALMLVVTGGSLGALHLNKAICAAKDELLARENLYIRHIAGPRDYDEVVERLGLSAEQRARWQVVGYEDRMGDVLAACDCVVSRAGATSLAEITALEIPALLVPFPHATADHQTTNARACVERGAALMVADDAVDGPEFTQALFRLVDDEQVREGMRAAAAGFGTRDAAAKLADVVIAAGAQGRNDTMHD